MQGLLVKHLVAPQRLNGWEAYCGMRLMQLKLPGKLRAAPEAPQMGIPPIALRIRFLRMTARSHFRSRA